MVVIVACPSRDLLKMSPKRSGLLKGFSDPVSTGRVCHNPRGRPEQRLKTATGTSRLLQAILNKWYFHTVPGAHTTPGGMNLSTGTQNKSLVHDASKETRPEGARQSGGVFLRGTHKGRRSGMPVPMQPTPLCEDASMGNVQVIPGEKHLWVPSHGETREA